MINIFIKKNEINEFLLIAYKGKKLLKSKLLDEYFSIISNNNSKKVISHEKEKILQFFNFSGYHDRPTFKLFLRKNLLDYISKLKNKTINHIDTFYITQIWNFGNNLIATNNYIFYCEIIGCHNIILSNNVSLRNWLIKDPIVIDKLNITIKKGSNIACQRENVFCPYEMNWNMYFPKIILPQIRTYLIKEEILKNLPLVYIHPDSLYIHIRGGDIWNINPHPALGQPPLCYYEKIINNNNFKNIYIISNDKSNLIINALMNKHENIIHNMNNFQYDISLLSHAYNIAISISTFAISSIKLNDNLKNLWEYDMLRFSEKIYFLHHHFYTFEIKYKIHTMRPSDTYLSKMFFWNNSPEQKRLMLEEDCPYNFAITSPNM